MKKDIKINLVEVPQVQEAIEAAKSQVEKLCAEAGVSTKGFEIDHCFCDWGNVSTSSLVEIIDGTGHKLGAYGSENYNTTVSYICEQVTEYFKN